MPLSDKDPEAVYEAERDTRCLACDEMIRAGDEIVRVDDEWIHLECDE